MIPKTKHLIPALVFLAAALTFFPAATRAQSGYHGPGAPRNVLGFEVGLFSPTGDSAYWDDKTLEFTGDASDFDDLSVGFDYMRLFNERLGLLVSTSFWEGDGNQSYLDFTDHLGAPIRHTTSLEIFSVNLGLIGYLGPRSWPVVPYLGAGGGFYFYDLSESGDFINFALPAPIVFSDTFSDDGSTLGYYGQAGLEIPLGPMWAIHVEGRWQWAESDLGGDFDGFGTLDLSGSELRAGVSWKF
jgi:opacity protein-like surface antigen